MFPVQLIHGAMPMSIIKRDLPLVQGVLLGRRGRFLADIRMPDESLITAQCANTGSMKTCNEPGRPVMLSLSPNEARRYRHTWELIDMGGTWVNVNTGIPNNTVGRFIDTDAIDALKGYPYIRPEVKYGREGRSRIDLLLTNTAPEKKRKKDPDPVPRCKVNRKPDYYVEVKNTSMRADDHSIFPDSVTERGQKHLEEMMWLVSEQDCRAAMVYFCGRTDTKAFRPADEIDKRYGRLFREAVKIGVEMIAIQVKFTPDRIQLVGLLPVDV
jgi:sugar fermentation stimulation protein A